MGLTQAEIAAREQRYIIYRAHHYANNVCRGSISRP
jgi:hypothetical protein